MILKRLLILLMAISALSFILSSSAFAMIITTRYVVTYHANNGTTEANVSDVHTNKSFTARPADTFSKPGLLFFFKGWSFTEDGPVAYEAGEAFTVTSQTTNLFAKWERLNIQILTYSVTYHANNGLGEGDLTDGPYVAGVSITARGDGTYTPPSGKEFAGWSLTATGSVDYYAGEVFVMPKANVNLYAVWSSKPVLNRVDHFAYMQGYPNGTFGPVRNMTRAEAVKMFSNLLTKQLDISTTYTSTFTDIPAGIWYANAVGYMQQHGVLTTTSTKFRPDDPITRAEFADLAVSFENLTTGAASNFSDVPASYWAYNQINYAVARGWLSGYPDGTFSPDSPITRQEVVTLTNRVLERSADLTYIDTNTSVLKQYSDISSTTCWAYYDIMEASVGHNYTKFGTSESWLSVY